MSAPRTNTAVDDRLAEAHEQLAAAVERLVSGEDWAQMLTVASRFHRYSLNNVLLIQFQKPDATRVAGYRAWQALGHQVRRGEHGLAILAPILRRVPTDPEAAPPPERTLDGSPGEPAPTRQRLAGFKLTKVFDISQTDGPPLPDVLPELLTGDAPHTLYEGLAAEVERAGFTLRREDCSPANGRTDFGAKTVTVRPDCSPAQAAKTLAHELGHVRLHDDPKYLGFDGLACRGLAEVEAESVAFLVCSAAGLPTGEYSFPYVARWASGDVAVVRSAAERSLTAARTITSSLGLTPAASEPANEAVLERTRDRDPSRTSVPAPSPVPTPARSTNRSVAR